MLVGVDLTVAEREGQEKFIQNLDALKQDKLFVRYVFSPDFAGVEEFAVSYWTIIDEKIFEVIQYDCSKGEDVNVHRFFSKKLKKRYLDKEKSFDTLMELVEDIEANWRIYRLKFMEKKRFI